MTLPGFTAEMSVRPNNDKLARSTLFGSSGVLGVLPIQSLGAAVTPAQFFPWPPPWMKRVACCVADPIDGRPRCSYSYVPLWWSCQVRYNPYACWTCSPGGVFTAGSPGGVLTTG